LYFPFERNARLCLDPLAHFLAQRLDIGTGCLAQIEQEVGMLLADLGAAQLKPPTPCFVNQLPGLVPSRVLEG